MIATIIAVEQRSCSAKVAQQEDAGLCYYHIKLLY